ncbi:MAG: 1,4-alpha-glucan branching enzyme [Lachnospiraceae bacterium]|nr:1,4-alpha-glucan branching enzyme [Lachnospiraceae bacterium]
MISLRDYYNGQEFGLYEYLGAHFTRDGVVFRTYAPAARALSVIGEFSGWQDIPMERIENGQFWECTVKDAREGQMYKFKIYQQDGKVMDHADPYAFFSEKRPGTASILYDRKKYSFHDRAWMNKRTDFERQPLTIYEMHMGSWRRHDQDPDGYVHDLDEARNARERGETPKDIDVSAGWYDYSEMGDMLVPYLRDNGFNCVEFMPLNEYPADESWGYQSTGFFSATSRYGHPDGLKKLIDQLHKAGIAVILDIVTVHFAVNDYALWNFDGTPLYEYNNAAIDKSEWGSCNFNHSRGDICSFLNSASDFWLHDYHFDGLRFDAVGNLIYWGGNEARGVNTNTVEFIRNMNKGLKERHPTAMLIAEDSSSYPGVTKPVRDGGLGFDYKWDMGWMNDTLHFFQTAPEYRTDNYHKLTFSMQYFYNEHFLLPFSHDEVVHGKASIIQKMAGDYPVKFPQVRGLYLYMFLHPGKKLNFMGNEFAQFREWDEKREQDWGLLTYPVHDAFHRYFEDLNKMYEKHPALWEEDFEREGFEWIEADDTQHCLYAFFRKSKKETLLCVFNFSGSPQSFTYKTGFGESLELLMDSENDKYGGQTNERGKNKLKADMHGNIEMVLPAYGGRCYNIV